MCYKSNLDKSKQASKQKIDNKHTQKNRKFRFNWILVINEPPKKQKKNQLYACKIHTRWRQPHTESNEEYLKNLKTTLHS